MSSGDRILLTGASGFIGSHLRETLVAEGRRVRVVTRRASGAPDGLESMAVGDLDGPIDWAPALSGVDAVVHCAARAHVLQDDATDPLALFRRVNRDATLVLAEAAAQAGVRRFIFLSSIGVLGERTAPGAPFTGGSLPAPEAPYAVSKLEAEQGLLSLAARTGLEVVIVRPPLVHGAGAPGNFGRLLRLVRSGLPLPLGGLENRRTFVGRRNLVDLLRLTLDHPRAPGAPLLVGDDRAISTSELLRLMAGALGRRARLFPVPGLALLGRLPGPGRAVRKLTDSLEVDFAATTDRLGWRPRVSVEEGIEEMVRAPRAAP